MRGEHRNMFRTPLNLIFVWEINEHLHFGGTSSRDKIKIPIGLRGFLIFNIFALKLSSYSCW